MDHLDLFNPETYPFFDALFKEYLSGDNPVFRGKRVHVGTDEYSNRDTAVVEKFRGWSHAGHITLQRGERSRLADYASEVL